MSKRIWKIVGSGMALLALLWWVDAVEVAERLRRAEPLWLLASVLALTLSTLSMARRWQMTAQRLGLRFGYVTAVKEYYLAQLLNFVLPGGIVGDVGRAVRVRGQAGLVSAAQSVAAERIIGQVAMLALLGLGFAFSLLAPGDVAWPSVVVFAVLGALLLGAGIGLALFAVKKTRGFSVFVLSLISEKRISGHAILAALLLLFGLYACARATGTILPVEACFTLLPLVFCAMLVPFSIGGLGWREGAAAVLFPMLGFGADAGVAMGLAYGVVMVLATLPALVFLVWGPQSEAPLDRLEQV